MFVLYDTRKPAKMRKEHADKPFLFPVFDDLDLLGAVFNEGQALKRRQFKVRMNDETRKVKVTWEHHGRAGTDGDNHGHLCKLATYELVPEFKILSRWNKGNAPHSTEGSDDPGSP
jgi:hypothetical protein